MTGQADVGHARRGTPSLVTTPARAGSQPGRWWVAAAVLEVAGATGAVLADLAIPALVLLAMAVASLLLRRQGPSTLGFHRVDHAARMTGLVLGFTVVWTLFHQGVLIPVVNRVTGERQDMSDFAELEGNLGMLALLLVLSWTLAALGEEAAFRGYLLTRVAELFGGGRVAVVVGVLLSSLLFGLVHTEQGVVGVALVVVDGLVFSALRLWFGTLWAPVLAHGFNNTLGFVAFYLAGPFYGLW